MRTNNGRYQHNWESYIHKYRFTDYAIELSYIDGDGNQETITSSDLFTLNKSDDFDLDNEYNGNLTRNLKLNKDSSDYKLQIGNIEKDPDGIANIKYLSYKWYKDNNLIKETSNNSLIINKNDYFGNWKVDVEYKDDNNFRNIVSSSLNIKDDKKNNISFPVELIKEDSGNGSNLNLKAFFNFNQETSGIDKDSVYYQWFKDNNLISVTQDDTLSRGSTDHDGTYKVILNYKDNLGFNKTSTSSRLFILLQPNK